MTDNNEKSKQIHDNFEKILPRLWDKARTKEVELKSEYLQLQIKLLNEIKTQIPSDDFRWWFDGKLAIKDISEDNQITISSDSGLNVAMLQLEYSDMLKKVLNSITNNDADFELSFVVREDRADNIVENKNTAFDFLIEDNNNEYDEEYEAYIEGKSHEELFELAFGKKELERQKELHQKRRLKPDYKDGLLNISECKICSSTEVPNQILEIPVNVNGIVSVSVLGAKCSNPNCLEEYYNIEDTKFIREFKELIKRQALIDQIKPMHLQLADYRKSSAEAESDED